MNIVVLTTESPASFYLLNEIHKEYPIKKVFFWYTPAKSLKSRIGKLSIGRVRGHVRYLLERIFFCNERKNAVKYGAGVFPDQLAPDILVERVPSLNSRTSIEKIQAESPDLILVQGTEILREGVLKTAKREIINLHPGIVPDYRGGGLPDWVFYNNDFDKLGVTVHVCTKNVDEGPILGQARYSLKKHDEIYMLSHRLNTLFIWLTKQIIAKYTDGSVEYQPQGQGAETWRKKDLTIFKQVVARRNFRRFKRTLKHPRSQ